MSGIKGRVMVLAAAAMALGLNAYAYLHSLSQKTAKIASADECADTQALAENPDKTLFISCGGFLE